MGAAGTGATRLSPSAPGDIVGRKVQVTVNDEPRALPEGATVADLVAALQIGPRRIAVELNRTVVRRADYACTTLRHGYAVEVIHFVGGG